MGWLNSVSTCWPPGQGGCVVWWDAWAAVGTIGAACIALWLGLQPILKRRQHAKAVAKIAGIRLGVQLLHFGATCRLSKNVTTASDYNAARINAEHADSKALSTLIPYFDAMPKKTVNAVADCIADIDTLHALLGRGTYWKPKTPPPAGNISGMFDELFAQMKHCHAELSRYVGRPVPDITTQIGSIANSLSHVASLAELADWSEEQMRRHILGRGP